MTSTNTTYEVTYVCRSPKGQEWCRSSGTVHETRADAEREAKAVIVAIPDLNRVAIVEEVVTHNTTVVFP